MSYKYNIFRGNLDLTGTGGEGNVVGPIGGSTDNAIPRFDGTTGKSLQDSLVTIDDSGNITTPTDVNANNVHTTGDVNSDGDVNAGGDVNATNVNATNNISSATAGVSGAITAGSVAATGAVSSASLGVSGNATVGGTLGVTGTATAGNVTTAGTVTATTVNATTATITTVNSTTNNATTVNSTTNNVTGTANIGTIHSTSEAGSRAAQFDAGSNLVASTVTTTELGYVSGVTSSIQDQLDAKIELTEKGSNNGVATLDGGGKIPVSQLPNSVVTLEGEWNASTNTPTLADGVGNAGMVYEVTVAGATDFGSGSITFAVGDWAVYGNNALWYKSLNSNEVTSVNGQTGVVVLDTDDVAQGLTNKYYSQTLFDASFATKSTTDLAEGTNLYYTQIRFDAALAASDTDDLAEGTTNLYFTDERAQDAVGTILVDTTSVDLTYSDATPSITAVVLPAGVDHNQLQNYVANEHVDHTSVQIATASATSGLTGGGTIAATRNLSVDITGTTAKTSPASADELLIWDIAGSVLKKSTRGQLLTGVALASTGDLNEGSFTLANNQVAATDVTGLAFSNAVVRGFEAIVTISIDATTDLFEEFTVKAIQKGSLWEPAISSVGDDSGVTLSITTSGQVQYQSSSYIGFSSGTVKYRAQTTSV